MRSSVVMTLDMGTSSVRAMLFDSRGRAVPSAEMQLGYAQRTTSDGGVDTDAEVLLARTLDCVSGLLDRLDDDMRTRLAGVGISCFWHSLIGVGSDDRAATPVYSWADARSAPYVAGIEKEIGRDEYHRRTGCELHASFWPAKLRWLAATDPARFQGVARWMSFGEYVTLRLFGSAECSVSMASGTGLYNPNALCWDDEILQIAGITTDRLNPIVQDDAGQKGIVPEFADRLKAVAGVPWFAALGDGACSNAGSGAVERNRIAINVGTSAAMRVLVEADHVEIVPGLFAYRADSRRFVVGGAFANGGNVYAWEHDALKLPDPVFAKRRLATMTPDGHGLTILPFFAGERSPGWHPGARAAIVGLNLHTTPLDILRASFEAVAYGFDLMRERLAALGGEPMEIVASGGGAVHSPEWVQIMADVFGQEVALSRVDEASSRGAALFALVRLGILKDLGAAPAYLGRHFRPDAGRHEIYARARKRYEQLYDLLIASQS